MSKKEQLLQLFEFARLEQLEFIKNLSMLESMIEGKPHKWSARDIVAHITSWQERNNRRFEGSATKEVFDPDEQNRAFFDQNREKSWQQVELEAEVVYKDLVRLVGDMSEDDLLNTHSYPAWQEGRPLWRNIIGDGCTHPVMHYGQFYAEKGDLKGATRVNELLAERLINLDSSNEWKGTTIYNLACIYALTGNKAKAISELGRAFDLRPELKEWSKNDTDLDVLRSEAGFRKLVGKVSQKG